MKVYIKAEVVTNKGKAHIHNGDNYLLVNKYRELKYEKKRSVKYTSAPALFAICEGIGATKYGRKEAYYAVKCLNLESLYLYDMKDRDILLALDEMLLKINAGILKHKVMGSEMGTTLALLYFSKEHIYVANIGNNRIHQLTDNRLIQLTNEDGEVAITKEAMTTGHTVLRYNPEQYLGKPKEEGGLNPTYLKLDYQEGVMRFLCCTSGIFQVLDDRKILETMLHTKNTRSFCKSIIDSAVKSNSQDNLTVIAIHVRALGHRR